MTCTMRPRKKRKKWKPLICPVCTRGRLCDAPADCETLETSGEADGTEESLVIKCPVCGTHITVTIQ